jgi:hypothetical protein
VHGAKLVGEQCGVFLAEAAGTVGSEVTETRHAWGAVRVVDVWTFETTCGFGWIGYDTTNIMRRCA